MKFFTLIIMGSLLLAGCGRMQNGTLPASLQMGYDGKGSLAIYAPSGAAWRVDLNVNWLKVSPDKGIGTTALTLTSDPSRFPQNGGLEAQLQVVGDIQGKVKVTQPLMLLRGRIEAASAASAPVHAPSRAINVANPPANPQEILVQFRGQPTVPAGMTLKTFDPYSGWATLRVNNPALALNQIRKLPGLEQAEPNSTVTIQATAETIDQFYSRQWHLRATGARFAHLGDYPNQVRVAVIDTGVRFDHPDLEGRLLGGGEGAYDFVDSDSDPTDPNDTTTLQARLAGSHGTHVTGIIAARTGTFAKPCPDCTDSGTVGLAYPAPVKVLPLRVLDASGNGSIDAVAAAIRYAAGILVGWNGQTLSNPNPVQVINLSLGTLSRATALCDAVADAVAKEVVVVAAAGNYQNGSPGADVYPAVCPSAVSVGATDFEGKPTYYSQQNASVTLSAPGGDIRQSDESGQPLGILSTTWNFETNTPNYAYITGTSQASPQVAAAVALAFSTGKFASPVAALADIKAKATDLGPIGRDDAYGLGFLNLPGVLGLTLPAGKVAGLLTGPISHSLVPDAAGWFEVKIIAGRYRIQLCRDDSANGFCDAGEPSEVKELTVAPKATYDVGVLRLSAK
jgi:subtilisin family serine protease